MRVGVCVCECVSVCVCESEPQVTSECTRSSSAGRSAPQHWCTLGAVLCFWGWISQQKCNKGLAKWLIMMGNWRRGLAVRGGTLGYTTTLYPVCFALICFGSTWATPMPSSLWVILKGIEQHLFFFNNVNIFCGKKPPNKTIQYICLCTQMFCATVLFEYNSTLAHTD